MTAHVRANQASMEDNAIKCVPHNVLITNARMGHVSALRDIMVTIVNSNAMWLVKTVSTTPSVLRVLLVDTDRGVHKYVCVTAVHAISWPDSVNVRRVITARANAPDARTSANLEMIATFNVVTDVLIRHVTLHQESAMRVKMGCLVDTVTLHVTVHAHKHAIWTLGYVMNVWVRLLTVTFVTISAVIRAKTGNVTESANVRRAALSTTTVANVRSCVQTTANLQRPAFYATTREDV